MSRPRLAVLVFLIGAAFALRLYRLDRVPLRGDEAFAVRYWADAPSRTITDLAHREPHPLGTFLGFWAWKQAAGGSEFAMRYLSLLGNLIGVAALAALSRQLFRDHRTTYLAAALWAINPFQIWHAQDVRNYALWAAFSPLAMALFLRAAGSNRRRDWAFYVLAEALAAYTFFLEGFVLAVQVIYLAAFRRSRRALRSAVLAWAALGVLLIPWLVQIGWLAKSGYKGTIGGPDLGQLLTWFLPTLLIGDHTFHPPWDVILPAAWCALVAVSWIGQRRNRILLWLAAWVGIPAGLLVITSTRMNIFHPRYLIAVAPALLLLMAAALRPGPTIRRRGVLVAQIALLIVPLSGLDTLYHYYRGDDPKSPDWPALATYLEYRAGPDDFILQTAADPAFGYYYHGPTPENSLKPGRSAESQIVPELDHTCALWLVGRSAEAEAVLDNRLQKLSVDVFRGLVVTQYRRWEVSPDEVATPADVVFGDFARLKGYTIQGPDAATQSITVLLYWEPLAQTSIDYKVFAHLIGPARPPDGSPLWDQEDHPPLYGFASTSSWPIGGLIRDPYHVLGDPGRRLAPGTYSLEIGFYDPADPSARVPFTDAAGTESGSSYVLFTWTKK